VLARRYGGIVPGGRDVVAPADRFRPAGRTVFGIIASTTRRSARSATAAGSPRRPLVSLPLRDARHRPARPAGGRRVERPAQGADHRRLDGADGPRRRGPPGRWASGRRSCNQRLKRDPHLEMHTREAEGERGRRPPGGGAGQGASASAAAAPARRPPLSCSSRCSRLRRSKPLVTTLETSRLEAVLSRTSTTHARRRARHERGPTPSSARMRTCSTPSLRRPVLRRAAHHAGPRTPPGFGQDPRGVVVPRPRRTVLNSAWPWAIWYPAAPHGGVGRLSPKEQEIIREHSILGRAYGERRDLAHDVRLACTASTSTTTTS